MISIRHWWWIAVLALSATACGGSEPAVAEVPAAEAPAAPTVVIPEGFRADIEALDLATSDRPADQVAAWNAFRALIGGGEDALAVVMKLPKEDRPLLAMAEGWMRSKARATLGLAPLGEELAFTGEIEDEERRAKMLFRYERSAAGGGSTEAVEVDGTGRVRIERVRDGVSTTDERQLEKKKLLPFLDHLIGMKFWLQRGIRQVGAKDEALLTISQFRITDDGRVLVRRIEVWEEEAMLSPDRPLLNRQLGLIAMWFREFANPSEE
ncbi:MAG: hypothetical protein ABFS86_03570 [Planctomycetota bacterium]